MTKETPNWRALTRSTARVKLAKEVREVPMTKDSLAEAALSMLEESGGCLRGTTLRDRLVKSHRVTRDQVSDALTYAADLDLLGKDGRTYKLK